MSSLYKLLAGLLRNGTTAALCNAERVLRLFGACLLQLARVLSSNRGLFPACLLPLAGVLASKCTIVAHLEGCGVIGPADQADDITKAVLVADVALAVVPVFRGATGASMRLGRRSLFVAQHIEFAFRAVEIDLVGGTVFELTVFTVA